MTKHVYIFEAPPKTDKVANPKKRDEFYIYADDEKKATAIMEKCLVPPNTPKLLRREPW